MWQATAVRTIPAPFRPRSGGRAPSAVAELAVAALTVVSGLQLLRLMVSTMVGVYRDRLGASLAGLALFAFVVVALGLLAAPVARLLGRPRALVVSVAGVALVRLVLQLVPDATARWLLAPVGVVLFCWFVPLWLARDGRGLGLALLAGLAVDTALAGLGGSWDYAWSINGRTVALAVALALAAVWALAAVGGGPGPERSGDGAGRAGLAAVLPLAGVGPALFLHALVWQNLGWQAVLGGRSQEAAFLLVMVGNLGALAAGTAAALAREARWPLVVTAIGGLAVAVALGELATLAAGVLGQAATAVLLVVVVRRSGGAAGLGPTVAVWTAGMGLFVLLVFAYYAAYDMVLPAGNGLLPVLAAVMVGLAAAGAMRFGRDQGRQGRDLVPLWAGVALLAAPLLLWATAPGAVEAAPGPARPVRVMSYNLHFGFDVRGWSDLEGGQGHRGQRSRGGRAPGGLPGLVCQRLHRHAGLAPAAPADAPRPVRGRLRPDLGQRRAQPLPDPVRRGDAAAPGGRPPAPQRPRGRARPRRGAAAPGGRHPPPPRRGSRRRPGPPGPAATPASGRGRAGGHRAHG